MLDYYLHERVDMVRFRGIVNIVGLILILIALCLDNRRVAAQPSIDMLDDRTTQTRDRVGFLEKNVNQIERRLIKIETEIEQSRKQAESNATVLQGIFVGVVMMLIGGVARAVIFFYSSKGGS